MTTYQILCLICSFGFPSMFIGGILYVHKKFKMYKEEMLAIRLGVQALLRGQMIAQYNKWSERKYAPIWAKDNFENVWKNYHNLGANGVMNGIHDEFMALQTDPPEEV